MSPMMVNEDRNIFDTCKPVLRLNFPKAQAFFCIFWLFSLVMCFYIYLSDVKVMMIFSLLFSCFSHLSYFMQYAVFIVQISHTNFVLPKQKSFHKIRVFLRKTSSLSDLVRKPKIKFCLFICAI